MKECMDCGRTQEDDIVICESLCLECKEEREFLDILIDEYFPIGQERQA